MYIIYTRNVNEYNLNKNYMQFVDVYIVYDE